MQELFKKLQVGRRNSWLIEKSWTVNVRNGLTVSCHAFIFFGCWISLKWKQSRESGIMLYTSAKPCEEDATFNQSLHPKHRIEKPGWQQNNRLCKSAPQQKDAGRRQLVAAWKWQKVLHFGWKNNNYFPTSCTSISPSPAHVSTHEVGRHIVRVDLHCRNDTALNTNCVHLHFSPSLFLQTEQEEKCVSESCRHVTCWDR